jgi:hypothetical protein
MAGWLTKMSGALMECLPIVLIAVVAVSSVCFCCTGLPALSGLSPGKLASQKKHGFLQKARFWRATLLLETTFTASTGRL